MKDTFKKLAIPVGALGLALVAPALHAEVPNVYVGAGAGEANFDDQVQVKDIGKVKLSDKETAYKLYAGYRATENFAIEGGYRNFGKAKTGPFSAETDGWDVEGVGLLPIGPVDLFAKGGVIFWDTRGGGGFPDQNDHDLTYGLGGQLNLGGLWLRLESEWFDISYPKDIQMVSASVGFRF
ncbi:MAG: outer membrane beta-barrel protein [Arenicellales bacterium]|jgi:OOP family OmpA-OmpF porin